MTDRTEQTEDETSASGSERTTKRRRLSREERRKIDETAQPGAVYKETSWSKKAREDLHRIERAVDKLDAPGSHRAVARQRTATRRELPAGLRTRITEALGAIAYVQLAYSTREHHVCHVGLREDDGIEDAIVLVGPHDVRVFPEIRAAIDELETDREPEPRPEAPDPFGRVYPVEEIEGIGETFREELKTHQVHDTRDLWHADVHRTADDLDIPTKTAQRWRTMAELMAVSGIGPQYAELLARAGVDGIEDLAAREPDELVSEIQAKQETLDVRIQGNVVRRPRVERWIDAARVHPWPEAPAEGPPGSTSTTTSAKDQAAADQAPFGAVYPIVEIEGIGETYTKALAEIGIEDTQALWQADAEGIAEALDVSAKRVETWQRMAELMAISGIGPQYGELLARSGIDSIEDLASADAEALLEAIETKQKDLRVRIQGNVIQTERVQGWIEKARGHEPNTS